LPPPDSNPPTQHVPRWLLPAIVVAGAICRVAQYLSRRSFWEDESFIVLQLKYKAANQLMGPLAEFTPPQAAPPLWLLAHRGLLVMFGTHEYAMRLVALLTGIGALILFAMVARRLLSPVAAVVVVALFAFSESLIWHGTEVKPYSSDVFFATLLLFVALADRTPLKRLLIATAITAAGVWASYPLVFVFGGISLALLPAILAAPRARGIAIYLICNAVAVASFLTVLVLVIRHQQHHDLDQYWAGDMVDYHHPLHLPWWLLRRVLMLTDKISDYTWPAVAALVVMGSSWLWRRERQRLAILTLPLLVTLVAALARRYPLDGARVNLFLVPGLALLAGFGIDWLLHRWPAKQWAIAVVGGVIVAPSLVVCAIALVIPRTRSSARPAVEYVLAHRQSGDQVFADNVEQVWCYWPDSEPHPPKLSKATPAPGRFWLILTFRPGRSAGRIEDRLKPARALAEQQGPPHIVRDGGAAVYLFEKK
jgi:hypothetical protein